MSVLGDVVVVSLDIHIWSGRKKLRPADLTATGTLPPEALVSLGSKKIFDPDALKPFADDKREAESECLSKGVRFLKGFAIPKADIKSTIERLNGVEAKFEAHRESFLTTFDDEKGRWKLQYPGYERLIETEFLSKPAVAAKLSFDYQLFCVNGVEDDLAQLAAQGGASLVVGLAGQLFIEVANQARDFVKRSLLGRAEVTQKFLRPIRSIRGKLSGLAFLDSSVTPVVEAIDQVLAQMPSHGKIAGIHLEALRGICGLLSDPAGMREHGQRVLAGEPAIPAPQQPQPTEGTSVAESGRSQPEFWEMKPEEESTQDCELPAGAQPASESEPLPLVEPLPTVSAKPVESKRSVFL
jgi:hypothetical protein